ncbi:hypothetical protein M9435_003985 [Picochlorum sp. BPE23]|nr:hypothetical protein M9435_003985 [Picochlorum sp. BPE23]
MAPRHAGTVDGMDDGDSSDIHEVVEGVPPEMVWRGEYVEDVYAAGLVEGGNDDDDDDDGIFRILTEHDEEEDVEEEKEPVSGVSDVAYHDDDDDDDVPGISADVGGEEDFVARLQESIQRDLPKVKVSKEFQRMLDAVEKEEEEQGGHGLVTEEESHDKKREERHADEDDHQELLKETSEVTHDVDLGRHAASGPTRDEGEMESMIQGLVKSMNDTFPSGAGGTDADGPNENLDEKKAHVFWQLQPLCSNLLKARKDTTEFEGVVSRLAQILAQVDHEGLQACLDYALFPLSVVVDAAVSSRDESRKPDDEEREEDERGFVDALRRDDAVLETVKCMKVLLTRCKLYDDRQMASLAQKLMMLLSLPEEFLSEQPRKVVADILCAIFEKDSFADGSDCHGWLREESSAALVGNLIATLLNHPYNDVSKPSKLHTEVQIASLTALASLLKAVDDARVLAFFVPGISTGLVKRILQQSSTVGVHSDRIASKNSAIVVASMQALEQLVCIVFSDNAILPLEPIVDDGSSTSKDARGISIDQYVDTLGSMAEACNAGKSLAKSQASNLPSLSELESRVKTRKDILRVEFSWDWVQVSVAKLTDILKMCLPKLCYHENASVRLHLFMLVSRVMGECKHSFGKEKFLIDIVLILAQDSWPSVKGPAGTWLEGFLASEREGDLLDIGPHSTEDSMQQMLNNIASELRENEIKGRQEALKLASYVEYMSPQDVIHCVAFTSESADRLLQTFVDCFQIDVSAAIMIARSPSIAIMDTFEIQKSTNCDPTNTSLGAPEFPNALQLVTTKQTYDALAEIIRHISISALLYDCQVHQEAGASFARLIDSCTRSITHYFDQVSHPSSRKREQAFDHGDIPWQIKVTQVVIVLSELLFGGAKLLEGSHGQDHASMLGICKRAVLDSLNLFLDKRVWLLKTIWAIQNSASGEEQTLNAIVQHYCLNFVSVCARCLKEEFAVDGKCMHVAILPVIEKFASDYQFVSASARNAVKSICHYSGYENGIKELAQKNIDYIVDGMCIRLRQPSLYPDAPKLFAALLKESGVATALIPLLSEPAAHVVRGISIIQRREKPENVLAFVLCTHEIAQGAWEVAKENLDEIYSLVLQISLHKGKQEDLHNTATPDEREDVSIEEISDYFLQRRGQIEEKLTEDIYVTLDVWERLMLARKRLLAAARLEQSISDSVGPLAVSKSLPVAVQSLHAVVKSLSGLSAAHQGLEIFKNDVEEHIKCEGQFIPVESANPPSFLPSVHLMWRPLMGSLGDLRVPVIEASITCLKEMMLLAPKFLARRFNTDAWPKIQSLLVNGPPKSTLIVPGQEDRTSPAILRRIRKAILHFASSLISKLTEENAQEVMLPITRSFLSSLMDFMQSSTGGNQSIDQEMQSCFASLASIDPDAAWVLLYNKNGLPEPSMEPSPDLCMEKVQPILETLIQPSRQEEPTLQSVQTFAHMDIITNTLPIPWHGNIRII